VVTRTGARRVLIASGIVVAAAGVTLWHGLWRPVVLSRVDFSLPDEIRATCEVRGRGTWSRFGRYVELSATVPPGAGAAPGRARALEGKRPWKACAGDFDGDGRADLLVGVWKTTPFDRNPAPRPFVYNVGVVEGRLALGAKWLGSSLAAPFVDQAAGDVDGDGRAELVALLLDPGGGVRAASFGWSGFGFQGEALSRAFPAPRALTLRRPGEAGLYVEEGRIVVPGCGVLRYEPRGPAQDGGAHDGWEGILIGPERPGR